MMKLMSRSRFSTAAIFPVNFLEIVRLLLFFFTICNSGTNPLRAQPLSSQPFPIVPSATTFGGSGALGLNPYPFPGSGGSINPTNGGGVGSIVGAYPPYPGGVGYPGGGYPGMVGYPGGGPRIVAPSIDPYGHYGGMGGIMGGMGSGPFSGGAPGSGAGFPGFGGGGGGHGGMISPFGGGSFGGPSSFGGGPFGGFNNGGYGASIYGPGGYPGYPPRIPYPPHSVVAGGGQRPGGLQGMFPTLIPHGGIGQPLLPPPHPFLPPPMHASTHQPSSMPINNYNWQGGPRAAYPYPQTVVVPTPLRGAAAMGVGGPYPQGIIDYHHPAGGAEQQQLIGPQHPLSEQETFYALLNGQQPFAKAAKLSLKKRAKRSSPEVTQIPSPNTDSKKKSSTQKVNERKLTKKKKSHSTSPKSEIKGRKNAVQVKTPGFPAAVPKPTTTADSPSSAPSTATTAAVAVKKTHLRHRRTVPVTMSTISTPSPILPTLQNTGELAAHPHEVTIDNLARDGRTASIASNSNRVNRDAVGQAGDDYAPEFAVSFPLVSFSVPDAPNFLLPLADSLPQEEEGEELNDGEVGAVVENEVEPVQPTKSVKRKAGVERKEGGTATAADASTPSTPAAKGPGCRVEKNDEEQTYFVALQLAC